MLNKINYIVILFILLSSPLIAQLEFDRKYFFKDFDQKNKTLSSNDLLMDSIINKDFSQIIYQLSTDLDKDGDLDIILFSRVKKQFECRLGWLENLDRNGKFSAPHLISPLIKVKNFKQLALIKDSNDNQENLIVVSEPKFGKLDTVYFEITKDLEFKLSNNSSISKRKPKPIDFIIDSINISSAKFLDFDRDGDEDIIGLQLYSPKSYPSYKAVVLIENKNGLFSKPIKLSNSKWVYTFEFLDINKDGFLDLITKSNEGIVHLYKRKKNTNNFEKEIRLGYNIYKLIFFDLDQDDDLDFIGAGGSYLFWRENIDGNGTFGLNQTIAENPKLSNIEIVKINNDSLFDIVLGGSWYKNKGIVSNKITGNVKVDENKNGCDSLDNIPINDYYNAYYLTFLDVKEEEENLFEVDLNGNFQLFPGIGNFKIIPSEFAEFEPVRKEISFNFDTIGITKNIEVCLEPIDSFIDLQVDISRLYSKKNENGFYDFSIISYNTGDLIAKSGRTILEFDSKQFKIIRSDRKFYALEPDETIFDFNNFSPQKKIENKITLQVINFNINHKPSIRVRIELDKPAIERNIENNFGYHKIRLN